MTFEDYQRNLKGVNAGSDFDPDYLVSALIPFRKVLSIL